MFESLRRALSRGFIHGFYLNVQFATNEFYSIFSNQSNSSAVEANQDIALSYSFIVKRMRCITFSNSMDQDTIVNFRAGGVSIATITIPAGVNSEFDTGNLNVPVPAGTKINYNVDCSLSTVGSIQIKPVFVEIVTN